MHVQAVSWCQSARMVPKPPPKEAVLLERLSAGALRSLLYATMYSVALMPLRCIELHNDAAGHHD